MRPNSKRHRPVEIVAKLSQADEDMAKVVTIAEVDPDAVRRLEDLEKESARLKRLVAGRPLDVQILKANPGRGGQGRDPSATDGLGSAAGRSSS